MELKGNLISLEGKALNPPAVANFLENLKRVPSFQEPKVESRLGRRRTFERPASTSFQLSFVFADLDKTQFEVRRPAASRRARVGAARRRLPPRPPRQRRRRRPPRPRAEEGDVAIDLKQLEDKPWYYGLGIGVALAVALWAIANWQYPSFTDMEKNLAAKRAEYDALQQKIKQGRAAERRLPQLREEVRRIELDLKRLLEILPTKRNTEELIKKIEALTRQGDFFLKIFRPEGLRQQGLLRGVADRHPDRRHVPQPRPLLRPDGSLLADHQRRILVMTGFPDATGRTDPGRDLHGQDVHLPGGHRSAIRRSRARRARQPRRARPARRRRAPRRAEPSGE